MSLVCWMCCTTRRPSVVALLDLLPEDDVLAASSSLRPSPTTPLVVIFPCFCWRRGVLTASGNFVECADEETVDVSDVVDIAVGGGCVAGGGGKNANTFCTLPAAGAFASVVRYHGFVRMRQRCLGEGAVRLKRKGAFRNVTMTFRYDIDPRSQ